MDDPKFRYNMSQLLNYPEIDAIMGHKNAGSKHAYFDLLDDFIITVPPLIAALKIATDLPNDSDPPDRALFAKNIFELQKKLLAIGASSLLWETEKVFERARAGDEKGYRDKSKILASKLISLCGKLDDARSSQIPVEISGGSPRAKPKIPEKAAINPNIFEELLQLVEKFELDAAGRLTNSLRKYSYGSAIDASLAVLANDLTHFDQEGSETQVRRVFNLANKLKEEGPTPGKKSILAVDDVPDVLNSVKAVLGDNYSVYGVTNHLAALKFLSSKKADLILLDIELPEMDGISLLEVIRRIKNYEKTPVLFMTGTVTVENILKSRRAGGNDFLKKPVDPQVLQDKISRHLV